MVDMYHAPLMLFSCQPQLKTLQACDPCALVLGIANHPAARCGRAPAPLMAASNGARVLTFDASSDAFDLTATAHDTGIGWRCTPFMHAALTSWHLCAVASGYPTSPAACFLGWMTAAVLPGHRCCWRGLLHLLQLPLLQTLLLHLFVMPHLCQRHLQDSTAHHNTSQHSMGCQWRSLLEGRSW
jgi:hypothetical protein